MADMNLFISTLHEIEEEMKNTGKVMTIEEISEYFKDQDLTEEQEETIYEYLKIPKEVRDRVDQASVESEDEQEAAYDDGFSADEVSESKFYHMYLNEVKEKAEVQKAEMLEFYAGAIKGDQDCTNKIVDGWLMRIIKTAAVYKDDEINAEDLIQEGNMGLWMALMDIPSDMTAELMDDFLFDKVRVSMENYIREMTGDSDKISAILGKTALLFEAAKILEEENGHAPSIRELSEYTHIDADEISSIFALYKAQEE